MVIYSEVAKDGRVTIPIVFRKELSIDKGDKLAFRQENGVLEILTQEQLIKEAQSIVRSYVPENVSLVDDLIKGRRSEVQRELEDFEQHQKKDSSL